MKHCIREEYKIRSFMGDRLGSFCGLLGVYTLWTLSVTTSQLYIPLTRRILNVQNISTENYDTVDEPIDVHKLSAENYDTVDEPINIQRLLTENYDTVDEPINVHKLSAENYDTVNEPINVQRLLTENYDTVDEPINVQNLSTENYDTVNEPINVQKLSTEIYDTVNEPINVHKLSTENYNTVNEPINVHKLSTENYNTVNEPINYLPYKNDLKSICNISINKGMDLMKMKPIQFIEGFKNPCWHDKSLTRCIPYMHLVGAPKCGTTDLFNMITFHPDVRPPYSKETNWLTDMRFFRRESFNKYAYKYFIRLSKKLSNCTELQHNCTELITGDGSVRTLEGSRFWNYLGKNVGHDEPLENNPEYIYHIYNKSKILINVRNPVDRLWSEYLAFSKNNEKSPYRFHETVQRQINIYNNCLRSRTLRACMYDNTLAAFASVYIRRGVYHVFIRDYLKVFPREQVLIQRLEDIAKDRNATLFRTFEFLDLKKLPEDRFKEIVEHGLQNPRKELDHKVGDMLNSTRQLLYEFYKPHNEALANLLHNRDFNYGPMGDRNNSF